MGCAVGGFGAKEQWRIQARAARPDELGGNVGSLMTKTVQLLVAVPQAR